jgi:hypothetical protein
VRYELVCYIPGDSILQLPPWKPQILLSINRLGAVAEAYCFLWCSNWDVISQKTAFVSHRRENLKSYKWSYVRFAVSLQINRFSSPVFPSSIPTRIFSFTSPSQTQSRTCQSYAHARMVGLPPSLLSKWDRGSFPAFMDPGSLLRHSKELCTCTYLESDQHSRARQACEAENFTAIHLQPECLRSVSHHPKCLHGLLSGHLHFFSRFTLHVHFH